MKIRVMLIAVCCLPVMLSSASAYERVFSYEPETEYTGTMVSAGDMPKTTPEFCRESCKREGRCGYYTWYPAGVWGKYPRCNLMNGPFKRHTKKAAISGMIKQ
jgi:hypothetical protein